MSAEQVAAAHDMYRALANYTCECQRVGSRRCRCSACGQYFNSPSTFDRHRVEPSRGIRSCLSLREMFSKGWLLDAARFWIERKRRMDDSTSRAKSAIARGPLPNQGSTSATPKTNCGRCASMALWEQAVIQGAEERAA